LWLSSASLYCRGVLPKWRNAEDKRKQAVKEKFIKLYESGIPIPELAKDLKVPAPTLYDWRREWGVKRNARSEYVTDELRKRISAEKLGHPPKKVEKSKGLKVRTSTTY
jgi:transposase-like protein